MSDSSNLPELSDDEQLARFVVFSKWVRDNGTVRQDAFMPPPNLELSVTRHIGLSDAELWQLGEEVTLMRPDRPTLYGRADVTVRVVKDRSLTVHPTPKPRNHVNIRGWPADKPARKIIAQELAGASKYLPRP